MSCALCVERVLYVWSVCVRRGVHVVCSGKLLFFERTQTRTPPPLHHHHHHRLPSNAMIPTREPECVDVMTEAIAVNYIDTEECADALRT